MYGPAAVVVVVGRLKSLVFIYFLFLWLLGWLACGPALRVYTLGGGASTYTDTQSTHLMIYRLCANVLIIGAMVSVLAGRDRHGRESNTTSQKGPPSSLLLAVYYLSSSSSSSYSFSLCQLSPPPPPWNLIAPTEETHQYAKDFFREKKKKRKESRKRNLFFHQPPKRCWTAAGAAALVCVSDSRRVFIQISRALI